MYGISYEKCLYFLLLLIEIAALNCSAFRIDNSPVNTTLEQQTEMIVNPQVPTLRTPSSEELDLNGHRTRHHHQAREVKIKTRKKKPKQNRPTSCQVLNSSQKAYLANTVIRAKTSSIQQPGQKSYQVIFQVVSQLKRPEEFVLGKWITLKFRNETSSTRALCENGTSAKIATANILQSKEYLLFLDAYQVNMYRFVGTPELLRKGKIPKDVQQVTQQGFRIRPPKLEIERKKKNNRLKIICKAKGMPIPILTWAVNGTVVAHSKRYKITYKKKRSTLVIKDPENFYGQYQCRARALNLTTTATHTEYRPNAESSEKFPNSVIACKSDLAANYCYNGGTCQFESKMDESFCVCPDGYTGQRCDSKVPSQSSMYPSTTPLYTCKVGLSTKFYC